MSLGSSYALVVEVARFLRVEPRDVRRWIAADGLPATRVPTAKKSVPRIFLPDLQRWLLKRTADAGRSLESYEEFARRFEEVRASRECGVRSDQ